MKLKVARILTKAQNARARQTVIMADEPAHPKTTNMMDCGHTIDDDTCEH